MNQLKVKIEAVLNKIKSAKNIKEALSSIKFLFVKVEGRLDTPKTKKNIKDGLSKLPNQSVKINGKLDTPKTKKQLKSDLKKIDSLTTSIVGDLDVSKTKKQVKSKLKNVTGNSIDVNSVNSTGTGNITNDLDSASTSAVGFFAKFRVGTEIIRAFGRATKQAVKNVFDLNKKLIDIRMVCHKLYFSSL